MPTSTLVMPAVVKGRLSLELSVFAVGLRRHASQEGGCDVTGGQSQAVPVRRLRWFGVAWSFRRSAEPRLGAWLRLAFVCIIPRPDSVYLGSFTTDTLVKRQPACCTPNNSVLQLELQLSNPQLNKGLQFPCAAWGRRIATETGCISHLERCWCLEMTRIYIFINTELLLLLFFQLGSFSKGSHSHFLSFLSLVWWQVTWL